MDEHLAERSDNYAENYNSCQLEDHASQCHQICELFHGHEATEVEELGVDGMKRVKVSPCMAAKPECPSPVTT